MPSSCDPSERLLIAIGGRFVARPATTAARRSATAAATEPAAVTGPALVLHDLGGRPPQARADLIGDDLDDRALLAVGGLPRTLLEPSGHDHARALREGLAGILRHLPPGHDV